VFSQTPHLSLSLLFALSFASHTQYLPRLLRDPATLASVFACLGARSVATEVLDTVKADPTMQAGDLQMISPKPEGVQNV
jgi:hypothetical protein